MNTKQKQRNREEEIKKVAAALMYANEICKNRVRDKYNLSDQELIALAFLDGAKLADANPRRGLVKIEDVRAIYDKWLDDDNDKSDFPEYLANYCDKEGWI